MNDEFITRAIENDRILKAIRLVDRFETEIEGELRRVADEFVSENADLFDDDVDLNFRLSENARKVISYASIKTEMNRESSDSDVAQALKLTIMLRWLDPAEYGYSGIDGALCVTAYKINRADSDDHNTVKRQTIESDWDVEWCRDAYNNAPGVVYIPVESAEEIREGFNTLKDHFSEYGSEYGVKPDGVE